MDLVPSIGNNVGWNITSKTFTHLGYTYIPGDSSGQKGMLFDDYQHITDQSEKNKTHYLSKCHHSFTLFSNPSPWQNQHALHGSFLFSSGNYLLLNNWNLGENGDAAQIVSPVLQNAGVACLGFKLYLAKISSGTLSVYQRLLPSMELVLLSEEAKKSSRTPSEWKTVMITLRNSTYFQVGELFL